MYHCTENRGFFDKYIARDFSTHQWAAKSMLGSKVWNKQQQGYMRTLTFDKVHSHTFFLNHFFFKLFMIAAW